MPSSLDPRLAALPLARGRVVNGIVMLLLPGLVLRLLFGRHASSPAARTITRLTGVREAVLGIGAVTCIKEGTLDAEWVSAGAVADAVDGLVFLVTPGVPKRSRLFALVGGGAAVIGMLAARAMADARAEAEIDIALEEERAGL